MDLEITALQYGIFIASKFLKTPQNIGLHLWLGTCANFGEEISWNMSTWNDNILIDVTEVCRVHSWLTTMPCGGTDLVFCCHC
jgi:hypothetical protein